MEVPKDKWLYRLWLLTFILSDEPPRRTAARRYRMRAIFLPLPVAIMLVGLTAFWAAVTVVANLLTVLSGSGVFVTWEGSKSYLREFDGFMIGDQEINPHVIAATFWVGVILGFCYGHYPQEFAAYWSVAGRVVASVILLVAVSIGTVRYADKKEEDDYDRILRLLLAAKKDKKPVPAEVVVFVDPPPKLDEEISGV